MKKQKMQLVLMVLMLLLLVGGYFGVQQYNKYRANKEAEDTSVYVLDVDSTSVTELSYNYEGEEYTFVCEDSVWKYQEDKELSIIQSRLNTMVNKVAKLAAESQIDNVTDLSVYGLKEPKQVITFVANQTTYKIAIGDYNSMSGLDYVNVDDSSVVYAVETGLGNAFDYSLEDLIEIVEEETTEDTATASDAAVEEETTEDTATASDAAAEEETTENDTTQ